MPSYKAAVCGDGINVANFEKLSQKVSGKSTLQEWREAVIDSLRSASKGDVRGRTAKGNPVKLTQAQAKELNKVGDALAGPTAGQTAWNSPDQLEALLDGKVPGLEQFGGTGSGYTQHKRPLWGYLKEQGLAYEGAWQRETSISWVSQGGKRTFADASEIPYFVAPMDGSIPPGTFAKITAPNGNSVYARAIETGPALGEVSLAVYEGLGYQNVTPNAAPVKQLDIQVFKGSGGMSRNYEAGYLSYDEIQRAGKLVEEGKLSSVKTRNDLLRAEGKPLQDESHLQPKPKPKTEGKKGGKGKGGKGGGKTAGLLLLKGYPTVAIGETMRLVGYANPACVHQGGGYVCEGSATVYVGQFPFARIGDATSDQLAVASGAETVFIGGPPTSAALVV